MSHELSANIADVMLAAQQVGEAQDRLDGLQTSHRSPDAPKSLFRVSPLEDDGSDLTAELIRHYTSGGSTTEGHQQITAERPFTAGEYSFNQKDGGRLGSIVFKRHVRNMPDGYTIIWRDEWQLPIDIAHVERVKVVEFEAWGENHAEIARWSGGQLLERQAAE